jgi:hypothetical protein
MKKKGIIPMNSTLLGGELNDEIEKKSIKKEQKKTRVNPVKPLTRVMRLR